MTARLRDAALAVLLAAVVGVLTLVGVRAWETTRQPATGPVGDRVAAAAAALRDGRHVYVAPDAATIVPAADAAALERRAAASPNPVFVVVWNDRGQSGYYLDNDAVEQVMREVGRDGTYVLYTGRGTGSVRDRGEARLDPAPPEDLYGDPVRRLTETVDAVATASSSTGGRSDYWGGRGGAVAAGLLFAALALPVLWLLWGLARVAARRPFRSPGGWT